MRDLFRSVDPNTGEEIARFDALDAGGLDAALEAARRAFPTYRTTSFEQRAAWLAGAAELLDRGADAYARLMSREMGKPLAEARGEARKCAWVCRHYAENGARFLAEESIDTEAGRSTVQYQPLGAILAVMPWNFPFWQVFRCAAPALMAGNVVLLKHAPNVPQCAIAIEGIFSRAGFPAGTFQKLFLATEDVPRLLDHPVVQGASVTGSVRAGAAVARAAGERIKPTVLELGGSDPFIVCEDADLERAADTAVQSRMSNAGQSCIAAKRLIVVEAVADEFERRVVERVRRLRPGDPLADDTDIGPLARADLRDQLERQVQESVEAGARLLVGGERPDRPGYFYAPTVLAEIPPGTPAAKDEIFGPVACLFRVDDADAAIALANDSPYGLGASVWTHDPERIERFSKELEVGQVFFNAMTASNPNLPFGGIKRSGYGRELGPHGIREFVNVKTIWVD